MGEPRREQLLRLYEEFPFHNHPLWRAVLAGTLSREQVILAEVQHCIRTKAGQALRREALASAEAISPALFEVLVETYLEECTHDSSGPSHLDLIRRLVLMSGYPEERLDQARATPGNSAAIALYRDISSRGAGCH